MTQIIPNLGYLLMLVAFLIVDLLWLRVCLMAAHVFLFSYGLMTDQTALMAWNIVFLVINGVQSYLIWQKRRHRIVPEDLYDLYKLRFSEMAANEFISFWKLGETIAKEETLVVVEGVDPAFLYFITAGEVKVSLNGMELARLGQGAFVGEMSFLSGEPASADVYAVGEVTMRRWSRGVLHRFREDYPEIWEKLHVILGRDLVVKIKQGRTHSNNA